MRASWSDARRASMTREEGAINISGIATLDALWGGAPHRRLGQYQAHTALRYFTLRKPRIFPFRCRLIAVPATTAWHCSSQQCSQHFVVVSLSKEASAATRRAYFGATRPTTFTTIDG